MASAGRIRWVRLLVRITISGASLAIFAMHISASPRLEIIDRIENYLYDVRVRITMPDTIDSRVVIVDIDEASQVELGQWPWPRNTLATIVDNLFDLYGVQVLGSPIQTIRDTEDRRLFVERLDQIGVKTARSRACRSGLRAVRKIRSPSSAYRLATACAIAEVAPTIRIFLMVRPR